MIGKTAPGSTIGMSPGGAVNVTANTTLDPGAGFIQISNATLADNVTLTLGAGANSGVTFLGSINGTAAGTSSNVTFNTTGAVLVLGNIGTDIGTVTVTKAGGAQFTGQVDAATVTLTNSTGTVDFQSNLNVTSALTTTGAVNNIAIAGGTIAGATTFANTGTLTLTGTTDFIGGVTATTPSTPLTGTVQPEGAAV